LTDNVGRTVPFADSIVLMTTNIGQPHFLNPELNFDQAKVEAVAELGQTYRSEFLNRFNGRQNILCFNRLNVESIQKIVHREISNIDVIYREQGIGTVISEEDLVMFCRDHYDPTLGARGLPGYLQSNLEPVLVNRLLEKPDSRATLNVGYDQTSRQFTYGFTEHANG
jgi:ATP-dependent Clp protease ATP-binding subunit ClpB